MADLLRLKTGAPCRMIVPAQGQSLLVLGSWTVEIQSASRLVKTRLTDPAGNPQPTKQVPDEAPCRRSVRVGTTQSCKEGRRVKSQSQIQIILRSSLAMTGEALCGLRTAMKTRPQPGTIHTEA